MATKWTSPTWRMPEESNQSKFENYSLDFDGTNDYIDCTDNDMFSFGNGTTDSPFSFFIWAKFGNITTNCFISKQTTGTSNSEYGFTQSGDTIETTFAEGVGTRTGYLVSSTTVSPSLITGQWYHIGFTYAGGSNPSTGSIIYVNGVAQSMSYTVSSYTAMSNNSAPVKIGELSGSVGTYNFNGDLAQGCFFGYELAQSQIDYLYNSGTPQNPMAISGNAPIAYYPLGGSSTGSSSTLTTPNESVPSATVFDFIDGNDTFIDCGANENILDFSGNNYTVSTWVNWDGTGDSNQMIASVKSSGTAVDFVLTIEQSSGKISYWNGSAYAQSNSAIPTGAWCMVTIIVKAGQKDFFINGVADGTPLQARSASATAGTKFLIGKSNYGSEFFNGKISNTQIWNSTLSPSEITTLYNYGSPLSGTQPQAANLKAWYKMGIDTSNWDGSNWVIGDSTASYSSALDFGDRTQSEYIALSQLPVFNAITTSAWIKTPKNNATIQTIISNSQPNAVPAEKGWVLDIGAAWGSGYQKGRFGFFDSTGSTSTLIDQTSTQILVDNKWHHIVALWDGTTTANAVKIFVDGLLAGQGTSTFTGPISQPPATFEPRIGIGGYSSSGGGGGNIFGGNSGEDGFISNVQTWNTALTYGSPSSIGDAATGQIAELYNNGTPLTTLIASSNMKLWYKLDNVTTGIQDSSGNSNNGTNNGATQVSSLVSTLNGTSSGMTTANLVNSDLTRSIPYSSYSMNFDGDARVQLANATGLNFGTGDFTYSLWVNTVDNGNNYFFGNSTDASANNGTIAFGIHSANDPSWRIWVSGETIDGTLSVSDSWKHCVIRRTSGVINVFVNSVKDTSTGTLARSVTNVGNIRIGTFGAAEYINGEISNFAIWDSSLTEDQIITIYNGGVPNNISSLSPTLWYSLGGDSYYNGSSFICPDLSTGSNDGTSTGMGSTALLGIGPGSTGNGTATGMNIPANLQGNAPNSTKNAFSINMAADDKTSSVPDISS